jgi:predicted phosphodiesterase
MRLQLLSDIHFEFHRDDGRAFVESLEPDGIDVLVLAGDIAVGHGIPAALSLVCRRYADAAVVYVHGNHEYYGGNREATCAQTREACAANANLHWLDCEVVELAGRRVLGAPLWFPPLADGAHLERHMTDFTAIESFRDWVYRDNARATDFLERELRRDDLVVTHHLPSRRSVSPRYLDHPLTPFFVSDVEALILERAPAAWFHGHTHDSQRYSLGPTLVACNPFGYAGHELNRAFNSQLVFDL